MKPIACGYVVKVCRKTFYWRFLTENGLGVVHEAQVLIAKLSAKELPFLRAGAYLNLLKGGSFRFSRLKWTKLEIKEALDRAKELLGVLN